MRHPLSSVLPRKVRTRRSAIRLESLEDRVAPANSLYVITQDPTPGYFGTASTLKEYTTSGGLVRSVPVVPSFAMGEQAHDLVVTPGQVHIYNGTTDASVYSYNGTTGNWTGIGQGGLNTRPDVVGSGGLAHFGDDVFATDMNTPEGPEHGIVYFGLVSHVAYRFAEDTEPIDVAAGLDGKLYSLDANRTVREYDPDPSAPSGTLFPLLREFTLPEQVNVPNVGPVTMDYRAIAVDQNGKVYAADWNAYLTRFDANGVMETSRRLPTAPGQGQGPPVGNVTDIDFVSQPVPYDGSMLVVGSTNGVVAFADTFYLIGRQQFAAGTGPVFVTVGPSLVEASITGPTSPVTEGNEGTAPVDFTINLSRPSAEPVSINWSTLPGTATANVDYQSASGNVTFAPGETTKTVTVNVIGDGDDELNESFRVGISAAAGAPPRAVFTSNSASVVIADDDPAALAVPAFAASAGDAIDTEGNGVFDTFFATTGSLEPFHNTTAYEKRSIIEFDTTGIDLGASPVVTLDVYVEFPWYQSTTARVYGYAGNGTAALDDSYQTGTLLGTLNNLSGNSVNTAWRRITLDRTALAGLMSQSPFLGIVIVADTPTFFDVRGTGSAQPPHINFWNSAPPVLPYFDVYANTATEGNPGASIPQTILFNIYLSQASTVPITVDYQTKDQPGVLAGVDYVAASGTLTYAPGETYKQVAVDIIGDTVYEADEYFYLELSNPTIASFHTLSAGGKIINDDARPTIAIGGPVTVTETDPGAAVQATFTVNLSNPSYQTITVNYATSNGTAAAGSDYGAASGTLTFAPGETSKTVPVTVFGDNTDEPDETFNFGLTGATNATIGSPSSVTGTILDNDPVPTITVADWSGVEGGAGNANSYRIRVSLSNPSSRSITVDYAMADGTATAGVDYGQFPPGTWTFLPGVTGVDFQGTIAPDTMYEPDETFTFTISNPTNAILGAQTVATGTILNDDPIPTASVNSPSVAEGNSGTRALSFVVRLSNPSYQPVTVDYATADGTATAGSDYTAVSGSLTFAPGESSKTVDVTVFGDVTYEPDETFTLRLSNAVNATLPPVPVGTGTITNDDSAPTVSVNSPTVNEGDSGTTDLTFTVSLSNPSSAPVTIVYATANGTATAGSDYTAASGTVTFAPGETSKTVTVAVIGDRTCEPDETVKLNVVLGTTTVIGTGTIANDDARPTVSASAVTVDEGGPLGTITDAVFTVSLTNPSAEPIRVDYRMADGTALADDLDFGGASGTLTFNPGETTKTVTAAVFGDSKYEPDETFSLDLSNAVGATLGADGIGTIRNDDAVPVVQITDGSVTEGTSGTTPMFFTVWLSNPSYQPVTVDYGTADGTATAGSDYAAASGTLTFAPGEMVKDVKVDVLGDNVYEGAEQFFVNLSNPTNATGNPQGTETIADDDLPTVTAASASVAEGDAGTTDLVFTLSMSDPSVEPVTVNYATANGTATAGSDYTTASGSVTFAPGQTTKTVAVSVTGETDLEPDETFNLNLSLPGGANAILGTTSAVGTILNDDYAPVANAGADQTSDEGSTVAFDGSGSFDPDGDPLTFSWNFGDGGTGSGVAPTHRYTDNGTFTVTLTVNDGHGGVATDTALVTVRNVAPTAGVTGPATGVRGQARAYTLSATDPSPVDQAAPFGYRIDWGDGTTSTATGAGAGTAVTHTFAAAGNYSVRVWATDKDAAEGAFAPQAYTSKVVEVQGSDLVVGGTTAGDTITVAATTTANAVTVTINTAGQGTFTAPGQIVVYGQGGDDNVSFPTVKNRGTTYKVAQPLLVFGGDGNDTLDARNTTGAAVIVGGNGNDTAWAGSGRAILIGGAGADVLRGGAEEDLLIAGLTDYDTDPTGLAALRTEWARTDAGYAVRQAHLLGTTSGGFNGTYALDAAHVHDDGGAVDNLYGNGGQDWFFAAATDRLNDRVTNETVTGL